MRFRIVWLLEVVVGLALLATFFWQRGGAGLLGSLLGSVLVLLFFGSTLVVMGPIAHVSPSMSQPLGILFFLTKALILGAILVILKASPEAAGTVDPLALGVTVIVGAVVWTVGHTIDLGRARIPTYDLPDSDPDGPARIDNR